MTSQAQVNIAGGSARKDPSVHIPKEAESTYLWTDMPGLSPRVPNKAPINLRKFLDKRSCFMLAF